MAAQGPQAGSEVAVVTLDGEIDLATLDRAEAAIAAAVVEPTTREVIVDLSHVTFMSVSVVPLLARTEQTLVERRGRLVVSGARPLVRRVLALGGLSHTVDCPPVD